MAIVLDLDAGQRGQLAELLSRCVVQVQVGTEKGTGFFIAPGQVLTCRHVVASAIPPQTGQISVRWWREAGCDAQTLDAALLETPPQDWPDIAILSVPAAVDNPCVILDASPVDVDTRLLTAGYPVNADLLFQPQEFTAGYLAHDEKGRNELRFTDDIVKDGMSGSPIISVTSGLVVGIMRMTKGSGAPVGGFGTLLAHIVGSVPFLQPLTDRPPMAAKPWLDILRPLQLRGRDRETGARNVQNSLLPRIDLIVEQSDREGNWQIAVRATRGNHPERRFGRAAADLGNDVIRAVDGWSRHQLIRQQDLRILGTVLDRALLPVEARTAVDEEVRVPPLLLRVCVDNAGELSRLPWEYACSAGSEPLSVDPRMAFARFVDVPSDPPAAKDQLRVLAVIEMPESEARKWLLAAYHNEVGEIIRPNADEFLKSIKNSFSGTSRIQFQHICNQSADQVKDKLREGWDIVHYIGFAWDYGEPAISLGGGPGGELEPARISELTDYYLALSGCSVFVAQFHRLEPGSPRRAITDLDSFTPLLKGDLQAVIVTRYPVDVVDFSKFNTGFYRNIANGKCVEEAVQSGRNAVKKRLGQDGVDALAFGSFTVTTRSAGEIRLLTQLPGAQGPGPQDLSPAGQRTESGTGAGAAPEDTTSLSTASGLGALRGRHRPGRAAVRRRPRRPGYLIGPGCRPGARGAGSLRGHPGGASGHRPAPGPGPGVAYPSR